MSHRMSEVVSWGDQVHQTCQEALAHNTPVRSSKLMKSMPISAEAKARLSHRSPPRQR